MLCDELFQLTDQLCRPPELELGVDPLLDGEQPPLLQPPHLRRGEGLVLEICEWTAAPQREGLAEGAARRRGITDRPRPNALLQQLLEAIQIELAGLDMKHVARGPTLDPVLAEQPAQPRDVVVERVRRASRRRLTPQSVDQPIAREGAIRIEQKHRENRPLLRAAEHELPAVGSRRDRAEDGEL